MILNRFVELGEDQILLPRGLWGTPTQIAYADIEWINETVYSSHSSVDFGTKLQRFEIQSSFFDNANTYGEVRDFLISRVTPKQREKVEGCFASRCSYSGSGQITNSADEVLFSFRTLHPNPNFDGTCYGLYRLPDFVVYDKDGKEWIRIKRVGRLPHARFAMFEHGEPICIIQQRSPLRNRYILKFANGPIWKIRLPLFTVFFSGDSDDGCNIRIRLWSHNCWLMQISPATLPPHLIAAIAFLHRERLRCN